MQIAKITSSVILIIMAATWGAISFKHGFMIAVSDNFMYLGCILVSILTGEGMGAVSSIISAKLKGPKA